MKGHQRIAEGLNSLSQRDLYSPDRDEYHLDENGQPMSIAEVEEMIRENDDRAPIVTKQPYRQPIPMQDYYSQQVQQNTRHYDRSSRLRSMGSAAGLREKRNDESNLEYEQRVNRHY